MNYSRGNQAVEFERLYNRSFLVRRTLGLLCILAPGLVVALPLDDPVFLLDLCDVQGRNLETAVLEDKRLDLLVGRAPLKLGDIQPLKREFDLHRAMWICFLGKAHYSLMGDGLMRIDEAQKEPIAVPELDGKKLSKELLAAIEEARQLMDDPNAQSFSLKELFEDLKS